MDRFLFGSPVANMSSSNVTLGQLSYFTPDAVQELAIASNSLNRKGMRNLVEKLERKYKEDIKQINDNCREELVKAEEEMREEISHFYMGSMYTMFVACMKDAGLADRTCKRVLGYLAGNLNQLESGEITISDIKEYIEDTHGFKIIFQADRSMVATNMFEEDSKDAEAEKKGKK